MRTFLIYHFPTLLDFCEIVLNRLNVDSHELLDSRIMFKNYQLTDIVHSTSTTESLPKLRLE